MRKDVRRLLALAEALELFHTTHDEAYAAIPVNGHLENWPIAATQFAEWLARSYYVATTESVSKQDVCEAQRTLAARARFDGAGHSIFLRVAEQDGRVYLDLGNEAWQVVEIDSTGWRVVDHAPVRFRRPKGMRSLPEPQRDGAVNDLRQFLNVTSDNDWKLLVGFLMSAYRAHGPYPLAFLLGEHGSTKSTAARMVTSLIDPKDADLRAEPRSVRDLMIAANHSWALCFDNLSHVPVWLSDGLCRLSSGCGFATRQLFSDAEQILVEAQRPMIITGIGDLVTRGDLLDRSLIFELPLIEPVNRRAEGELWREFEIVRPHILGALLDGVAGALQQLPATVLPQHPRMADFALWGSAAERRLGWEKGSFLAAYEQNHAASNENVLDTSPITAPLLALLSGGGPWRGQASSLLRTLDEQVGESVARQRSWPKNPKALADLLRRLSPNLRATGVTIEFWRSTDRRRTRMIALQLASGASAASVADINRADSSPNDTGSRGGYADARGYDEGAVLLFEEALAETRAMLQEAKTEGDLRAWAAAVRELRAHAEQRSRTNLNPRSSQANSIEFMEKMNDAQLDEFVRQHALALGFRAPAEDNHGSCDERTETPPGEERSTPVRARDIP